MIVPYPWHKIVVVGKLALVCQEYLRKGRQVYVEGKLRTREYDGKDGTKHRVTEIVAQRIQFLGKPEAGEPAGADEGDDGQA